MGKGSLLTLAALTGVVLLGLGALGGAMLSNANDNANDVDIAAAPETTATARVDQSANSSGQTSRSEPRPSTTAAPAAGQAPTSTVPPTALTTATTVTSASTADPNALVADFHWSPDPPAAGQSISITDASTGNPNRWTWRWNGNTVSSSQPKGFTTSLREDTAITLTVCRGNGSANCASVTKTITVS